MTALLYRFETTARPVRATRLKVEINTREHFSVLGYRAHPYQVENPWFCGSAALRTFETEELLGTKPPARYQRRKGRDLFDLAYALDTLDLDDGRIVDCFLRYLKHGELAVSRAEFEANLAAKVRAAEFVEDVHLLLAPVADYDAVDAAALIGRRLLTRLPGAPWKGATA